MTIRAAAESAVQVCDECEKTVVKIWRTYKSRKYCSTCYTRIFKRKVCPSCGNYARLNKYESDAVCSECIRAKPCARCGKTNYKTGKLSLYGMVCNACAPYFRNKEPCELCGQASNRLSKISRQGHDLRICPKCQRIDHARCHACGRHRILFSSNDKHMLCKICLEQGKVICTKCSQPMPAGYGKSCEACYWQGLLDKRTYINCSAFTSPKMEIHFREFASWLGVKVGTHKAAITLNRYLSLFLDIENKLTGISSYEAMLNSFGAAKLRKYLLPMKWMEESGLIVVDAIAREANTERCRIESLLNKLEAKSKQRQLADGYYQLLKTDLAHNKTTIRSIRLALSPAIHLMLQGAKMSIPIPNQKLLDNYLSKSVGQRSSISGFVCYLRDRQGIEIKLPKLDANKALLNRRRKLESEILALMKADKANAHNREWLCVALEYFHGMPKRVGKTIASENLIYTADGGVVVCWNGLRYWLKAS